MSVGLSIFLMLLFCLLIGYFLGSINLSIIITKYLLKNDIRQNGSFNPGTTNSFRVYGKKIGIIIFLFDFLKGIIAVVSCWLISYLWLFQKYNSKDVFNLNILFYLSGLFCVIGHIFPIWFKFKGGKGVATTAGVILCLSPFVFLICAILFFIFLIKNKKNVGISSCVVSMVYPFLLLVPFINYLYLFSFTININYFDTNNIVYFMSYNSIIFGFSFIISSLILYKHKTNIQKWKEERKTLAI